MLKRMSAIEGEDQKRKKNLKIFQNQSTKVQKVLSRLRIQTW
uniref:Uncharacterized protein n=1 Tax=Arundo donax TaxID=35708 RepID=A0A0A9E5N2_ARUDO